MTRSIGEKLRSYKRTPGSFILMLLVMLSAIITFAVLLFLIAYILINGIPHIKPELFALKYTSENGSLFPALINTIIMTALSLIIAVPFGIFSAIFLVEYAKRGNKFINVIRITTETLSGIPSIVYGLFGMLFFAFACLLADFPPTQSSIFPKKKEFYWGRRGIFMYRKKAAYIYEPPFVIEESRSVCQYFEAAFGHEERMLPLSRR